MSKLNIVLGEMLYTNTEAGVRVLKGFIEPQHLPIALKELTFAGVRRCNQAIREAMNHSSLAHPNIVQIYDCFLEEKAEGMFTANIVTELMDRDLNREIEIRRDSDLFWTEPELLLSMRCLISALSFAQSRGVSHRDIKPQNIFTSDSSLKIGDFGASTRDYTNSVSRRKSLQGSPFFLSPELKRAYIESLSSGNSNLSYDPMKSDVYSLGLTLLFMARLRPPGELMNLERLGQVTKEVIQTLGKYPELQQWLGLMLEEDPEHRPSFEDMERQFEDSEASDGEIDHPPSGLEECKDEPPAIVLPEHSLELMDNTPESPMSEQEFLSGSRVRREIKKTPPKICIMCENTLESEQWISSLPPYISRYRVFAESCCSVSCMEKYTGAFKASKCPHCLMDIITSDCDNKPLYCGHCMHGPCWTQFIEVNPNKFRPGILNCPICHIETRYVKEKGMRKVGRFPRLKKLAGRLKGMFKKKKPGK